MSYYFAWRPYVSAAEKRRQAERELTKLRKRGQSIAPVRIEGRKIAKSFWGEAWCANLERYSDYENRLPRGRSYVRNGSVVDLQIAKGEVAAMVAGSDVYKIKIAIAPVNKARWKGICRDCAGTIDSLVELLQGHLAKAVMDRVCREGDGLFPAPSEIDLSCSCPDWADMCKHVAAALYGVGARLDEAPGLLFVLRGVDEKELIAGAGQEISLSRGAPGSGKVLDDGDVAALFGLEIADNAGSAAAIAPKRSKKRAVAPAEAKTRAATLVNAPRASPTEAKAAAPVRTRKSVAQRASPRRISGQMTLSASQRRASDS